MEQTQKKPGRFRRWGEPPTNRNKKNGERSDRPRGERSFGERREFKKDFKKDFKKPFKKDFKPREDREFDGEKRDRFNRNQRSFGDRASRDFGSREDRPFKKKFDKPFEKKSFDKKPFGKKRFDDRREERDFGDESPRDFAPREERPFKKKFDKPFEKKGFKKDFKKPFGKKRFDDRREDRGDRDFPTRFERKKSFKRNDEETEKKPTKVFEPGKPVNQRRFNIAATGKPKTETQENLGSFQDFDLPEELALAIEDAGFVTPTPIQAKSLNHTLQGRDLIGCAQTGTGKTAAFSIPLITRLLKNEDETALILAPTRELAAQIVDTLRQLTAHCREIRNTVIVGGAPYGEQLRSLRQGPRIVVATPGRLVDHLQRKTIKLDHVSFFVLDEADRMFDMGFSQQIDKIVEYLPKERQTLLFSATFNKQVKQLALKSLRNPLEVFIGAPSSPAAGVDQLIVETSTKDKFNILLEELNTREGSVLLFTGMKHRADRLADNLLDYGHSVARIHGNRSMGQRKSAIAGFRNQKFRILVATDIAARGLDISHVAHVINYDLPRDPEDYIHRIGRTARAGATGQAISFVTPEERGMWKKIEKLLPRQRN